jgi:hypothetical protein
MPKRSNAFQQAILLVKKELAGTSAIVQESAMLPNAVTGEEREVDVLIEKKIAGTPLRIAVECTDLKRKADASWVEKMFAKHIDLPTNALVLASRNGFTASAEKTAIARGIGLVNIEAPNKSLAYTVVGKLKEVFVKRVASSIERVEVTVFNEQKGENEKFKAFPDTEVVRADESVYGQMLDLVNKIRTMEQASNAILQNVQPEHKYFQIVLPGPISDTNLGAVLCVRSINPPIIRPILNLSLIGSLKAIVYPISLDSAIVDHRAIAWGEVTIEGKRGTILLDESESNIRFKSTFSAMDLRVRGLITLGHDSIDTAEKA